MARGKHGLNQKSPQHKKSSPKPWDHSLPLPQLSFPWAQAIIIIVVILCFANTFDANFVFDDSEAITGNKDVTGEADLGNLFFNDFWGNRLASNLSHKSYRPLTVLTFRLNHYLAGGLHPTSFHIINIILHGVVCILFLHVFSILLSPANSSHSATQSQKAAFLCALMFAVHPVHTECVAGVVGRADLLCALFFLLSFITYSKACQSDAAECSETPSAHSMKIVYLCLSMLLCCLAVLSKETGITVLGVCSAYDIITVTKIDLLGPLRSKTSTQTTSNNNIIKPPQIPPIKLGALALRHAVLAATGSMILATRWRLMGSSVPIFHVVDNPHSFVNGSFYRGLNYNYLYAINSWILLNPQWLCFDWSMGCIPVITSLSDPRNLATLCFVCVLVGLVTYSLVKQPSLQQRQLLLSLALLIIPFLPATNLLFRVGFVIAERILYLPSAGYVMLIVLALHRLCEHGYNSKLLGVCTVVLLGLHISRCIHRGQEWSNEKLLFESGELVCPLNAKVHYNIAKIHADEGNLEFAISKYRLAISLHPEYDQAMNNLANILKDEGQLEEAETLLQKAVTIRPDFAAAWMNLAIAQAALKKPAAAEVSYHTALIHRRKYPDCYYNLGNLYLEQGRHAEALAAWRNATLQKPTHVAAWGNMVILLDNLGRIDELDLVVSEALQHLPDEPYIHYNYANALGKAGRYQLSEKHFHTAIRLKPATATYYANMGVLYHRWGKYPEAEAAYTEALTLDPSNTQTLDHLNMLRKKMAKQDADT